MKKYLIGCILSTLLAAPAMAQRPGGTSTGGTAVPRFCVGSRNDADNIIFAKSLSTRYGEPYSQEDMAADVDSVNSAYNDCVASNYTYFEVTFTWGYTMVRTN